MSVFWKIIAPLFAVAFAVAGAANFVGGPIDADIDDQGVKDALQFAVVQHNRASNDLYISQVARVIKAQKQVVAGMKYIFTVEMAKTPCRKGGVEQVCSIHEDPQKAQAYTCTFEVWSRPWLSDIQVIKNACKHQDPLNL